MVVVMENFVEHQISKIVIRYLNDTIQRYGHAWVSCPNQEPETEFERNVVNLAAAFEKDHFPELVQLGNWLTMDCNEDYLRIKKILIADIRQKTNKPSDVLQYLLTWGGLQAVRAIVKNDPLLALEVKHFLQLTIKQELFDWWRNDGGWVNFFGVKILFRKVYRFSSFRLENCVGIRSTRLQLET